MPTGVSSRGYDDAYGTPQGFDVNHNKKDSILKSVREQEAQFERLTRELEEERARVSHKVQQNPAVSTYRIGSETESMNSISSTDDTFQWGGPQDDSLRFGDESHGLMDSCLHELQSRGTMHFGEDNMNYMPEDHYGGRGGPYSGDYNSYNGGPHHDTSMHSSHHSLQSNNSNRNPRIQLKQSNQNLGSRTSLPQDQHNDNYAPYSGLQRNVHPDSPVNGSQRGPPTPTRFNPNYYDGYGDNYRNSPVPSEPHTPRGYGGSLDPYDANPMQQFHPPDSSFHNDSFSRAPAPTDRYGAPQVEDSFYRQSPMLERGYRDDPRSKYMDSPRGGAQPQYPGDDRYNDNSFQGQPDSFHGPPDDYHDQPDSFQGRPNYSGSQHMIDRYGEPVDSRGPPPDDSRYQEEDSYREPQDDSFRGPVPQNDRHRDYDDDQPTNQSFLRDPHGNYGDPYYPEDENRRHEGLPQVQDDPFADDPFRQKQRSLLHLQQLEDPYPRGHSPAAGSERMSPGSLHSLHDRPPQYDGREGPVRYVEDDPHHPDDNYPEDRSHTPSGNEDSMRWRSPDLQEVIDFLSHPSDAIKANAAAYLTHLSYMDDNIKQKIRGLNGIPLLVDMLNSDFPEVHKNACGALKNMSYGRHNDENKRSIRNAGGIPALVRLLRKTQDEDTRDLATGVLWNLSSCDDLKKAIIDDALAVLVNSVVIPQSGWEKRGLPPVHNQDSWTTTFRNATGVLRNVSSAGEEARKRLRECNGLVDSLIHTLKIAIDQNNVDNKPVTNCVCTLRNLAFRIQEVADPDFYKKRDATLRRQKKQEKGGTTGCFGGGNKKKTGPNKGQTIEDETQPQLPQTAQVFRALWGVDAVRYFLQLLTGSNPTMLEASCGAIQNLAACDWKFAIEIRALVRKEKGLPSLVDLLTFEEERVVGAAATALRNLSIDERNKELVGKYAMKQLVSNIPQDGRPRETSDETVAAVLACCEEVIQHNQDFAKSFVNERGVPRLMSIVKHQEQFNPRCCKFALAVAKTLWGFKVLHSDFNQNGYTQKDFCPPQAARSQPQSNYSTLRQNQGYDDTTMRSRHGNGNGYPSNHMTGSNPRLVQGHSNPALDQHDMYGSRQGIPMVDIPAQPAGYAPIDDPVHTKPRNKLPAGAVPLFPVQKNRNHGDERAEHGGPGQMMLSADNPDGVDSWV
ncbi:splicing regulator ARVCF-like isoform X3 [Dreissena polymorpha]|uniref:splicing regulator ARVCF-like isoform X3 n=1 Tax=Dreissena polymorpha TaxID=45954 RepID=UPI002264F2F0|nr:splicing regulator ARVCF-like isoform X3 [Dreissena polymorpha]